MSKIKELNKKLKEKKIFSEELLMEAKKKVEELDDKLKIFVSKTFDEAEEMVGETKGEDFENHLLAGIPTVIKDNFNWEGTITTASSNMLKK